MFFREARRREAFDRWLQPLAGFAYGIAFRLTGNSFDAEDLTQEAFATAYRKLHQLRDPGKAKPWLVRILRNLYLRSLEKNGPELLEVEDGETYAELLERLVSEEDPEARLSEASEARRVQAFLLDLPEKYRTPLILFSMEEWTYTEIAEALEIPIGTVMSRISRGRTLLKQRLVAAAVDGGREKPASLDDYRGRGRARS